jgi:hypothetical protein
MLHCPTAIIRPKSQNSHLGYDGIPSVGNFILMIKNQTSENFWPLQIYDCSSLVTGQQPKKMYSFIILENKFLLLPYFPLNVYLFRKITIAEMKNSRQNCEHNISSFHKLLNKTSASKCRVSNK